MTSVLCPNVNHKVLTWARSSLNVELEKAAKKLKINVEDMEAIEAGQKPPTLSQLRRLSELYKRPIALFFLPTPPAGTKLPNDYRTRGGDLGRATLLSIRRARNVQKYISSLEKPPQPKLWKYEASPSTAAKEARGWLGIDNSDQLEAKDARAFFNLLTGRLHDRSIEVLLHNFPKEDAKAYSLADVPQLIVVSTNDEYVASRSFSILHELGHLSRGDSGICLVQEGTTSYAAEKYCDSFAANLLMPSDLVASEVADRSGRELADAVDEISDAVKASKTALLIRFEELGLISTEDLRRKLAELRKRTPAASSGGRTSREALVVKQSGTLLPRLVFDAYSSERLTANDAARMLNVSQAYLDEVGARLGHS